MTLAAHLRLGSLEILAALAFFGAVVSRLPSGRQRSLAVELQVDEAGASRRSAFALSEDGLGLAVGRDSRADVVLADPEASRRHARFDQATGVLYLSDTQSKNGTFLNGKSVRGEGIEVRLGDYIDVGTTRITVVALGPAQWT